MQSEAHAFPPFFRDDQRDLGETGCPGWQFPSSCRLLQGILTNAEVDWRAVCDIKKI